jgi:hypothetical protein
MRLSDLYRQNDIYLARVSDQIELQPKARTFESLSCLMRSMRLLKEHTNNAFLAKREDAFYMCVKLIEDEADEALHHLDNLRRHDRRSYSELIRDGEELLSQYVIACDLLIEKNIKKRYNDL